MRFHGRVASASGDQLFVAMLDSIAGALRSCRDATARMGARPSLRSLHDHSVVVEAVTLGDGNAAREAMLRFIVETAVGFPIVARAEIA